MKRPSREQRVVFWVGTAWAIGWLSFVGSKRTFGVGGILLAWILLWELAGRTGKSAADESVPPPEPDWFVVGETKFFVMHLATLGQYHWFWFYRQWRQVQKSGEKLWPLARTLFAAWWSHYLFVRVFQSAGAGVKNPGLLAGTLALSYILLALCWKLPHAYWLVMFGLVVPLLPVQRAANRVALQRSPGTDMNQRLTALNWIAIVVSSVFWLLVAIASLVPDEVPVPAPSGTRAAAAAIHWLASSAD